jgi:hypothetical protein
MHYFRYITCNSIRLDTDLYNISCHKVFCDEDKTIKYLFCGCLLTPFWSAKHSTRTVAVPSAQGRTVRDLVRGAAVLLHRGGRSARRGQTVRGLVQG